MPSVWVTSEADRPSPAGRPLHILPGAGVGGLRVSPFPSRPQETLSPCRGQPGPVTPHQEAALTPRTRAADQQQGVPGTPPPPPALHPAAPAASAAGRARNENPGPGGFPWMPTRTQLTTGRLYSHCRRGLPPCLQVPRELPGHRVAHPEGRPDRDPGRLDSAVGGARGSACHCRTQEAEAEAGGREPRGQL